MSVGAVVLAAGASTRFGRPKQLADWRGRPLLEHVIAACSAWPVDEVVVVLGARAREITAALGGVRTVVNDAWSDGLASSIGVGLGACTADRAFLVLGDQPEIDVSVPPALIAVHDRPAVVAVYRGTRSNPVLVHRSIWTDLAELRGDAGAAGLLRRHPGWVREVAFDLDPPFDIDTEQDLV